jgi:hypothetical protein
MVLAILLTAAAEALSAPALPGFVVGFDKAAGGSSIVERVPQGETVHAWTRMVTTQRFAGLAARTDANGFLGLMLGGLQRGCPTAKVAYRRPARSAAQMRVDCPLNLATGKPETFFAKAMPGKPDMHVAQVAFRRVPTPADVKWAEAHLAKVTLNP